MWQILAFLIVGCCYSLAEQHKVTMAAIPADVKELQVNGSLSLESRILDGNLAPIERYPYVVQVLRFDRLCCGGSLLTRRHVLSAAHCFVTREGRPINTTDFSCRVGSSELNTGGSVHRVSDIVNHERFDRDVPRGNDISVVLLATTVTLSASVATAIIPSQGEYVPDNATVWLAGWGITTPNGSVISPILKEVRGYTINSGICKEHYRQKEMVSKEPFPITDGMLCTGLLGVGGHDTCQGDSGGPVVYAGILVGVTSWAYSCGDPYYPGVKTRVSAYSDWIHSTNGETLEECVPCLEGKMASTPYPKGGGTRAIRPLELVHSDVVGPLPVSSWGGANFAVTFTDDYSRRSFCYLMKHKSEVTGSNGAPSLGQTSVGLLLLSYLVATVFSNKL